MPAHLMLMQIPDDHLVIISNLFLGYAKMREDFENVIQDALLLENLTDYENNVLLQDHLFAEFCKVWFFSYCYEIASLRDINLTSNEFYICKVKFPSDWFVKAILLKPLVNKKHISRDQVIQILWVRKYIVKNVLILCLSTYFTSRHWLTS